MDTSVNAATPIQTACQPRNGMPATVVAPHALGANPPAGNR
jgi:hypothetical protein